MQAIPYYVLLKLLYVRLSSRNSFPRYVEDTLHSVLWLTQSNSASHFFLLDIGMEGHGKYLLINGSSEQRLQMAKHRTDPS